VAIKSGVAVQPVAIYYRPLLLGKGQRWSTFCRQTSHITIRYLDPLLPEEGQTAANLAEATKTRICTALAIMESTALPGLTENFSGKASAAPGPDTPPEL